MKTKAKGYLVVSGVFLLGAAGGAGASYAIAQRQMADLVDPGSQARRELRLAGLARELGLTEQQRAKIRAITDQHFAERARSMQKVFERCPELLDDRRKLDDDIKSVLDEDQKKRFESLIERRQRWFREGRGPRGMPPP